MKIEEIQTLLEGLTFGQKEISQIQQESGDIRVGWEFEWKLDEEFRGDGAKEISNEEMEETIQYLMDEEVEDHRTELSRRIDPDIMINTFTDILQSTSKVFELLKEIKEKVGDNENVEFIKQTNVTDSFIFASTQLLQQMADLDEVAQEMEGTFDNFEYSPTRVEISHNDIRKLYSLVPQELFDAFSTFGFQIEDLNQDIFDSIIEVVNNILDTFDHVKASDISRNRAELHNTIEDDIRQRIDEWIDEEAEQFRDNLDPRVFQGHVRDLLREKRNPSDSIIESMKEILLDEVLFPEPITRISPDSSVNPDEGAEAVSDPPEELNAAMDTLERMLSVIHSYGFTDNQTGLHMSVSLRGVDMTKENFNIVKVMLLMDEPFVHQFFPERNTNVQRVMKEIGSQNRQRILLEMVKESIIDGDTISAIENNLTDTVIRAGKSTGLNINDLGNFDVNKRRIEFRYLGGKDYEKRLDTISFFAHRLIFMIKLGFDDEFAERDYMKRLVRFVDFMAEREFNMSFANFKELVFDYIERDPRNSVRNVINELIIKLNENEPLLDIIKEPTARDKRLQKQYTQVGKDFNELDDFVNTLGRNR